MKARACLITAVFLAAAGVASAEEPAPKAGFDEAETRAIEEIVKQYLLDHPEILLQSLRSMEERERLAKIEAQRTAVRANLESLNRDPASPVLGNPDGDVTVVEFFDYRCPYCRRVTADLMDTVEKDGNIRLVFKEFPILGPESVVAARAALAAGLQDRYRDFHIALMTVPGELSEDRVLSVAEQMGLDVERLQADMQSEAVEEQIRANHGLARQLQINGTPAFVIGDEVIPGALTMPQLLDMISRERAKTG